MTSGDPAPPQDFRITLRRTVISAALGVVTFMESDLLQEPLNVSIGEQLILSVVVSGVTVDAGGKSFEGGLWLNDLGTRYLDIQRAAQRRGIKIRRIFVFDAPDHEQDPSFIQVRKLQREAGIEVRGLDLSQLPLHLRDRVSDFIVFDKALVYETTRTNRPAA